MLNKTHKIDIFCLILFLFHGVAFGSDISTWSTTTANNNSAFPDGFTENMGSSGINGPDVEVMAQVKTLYDKTNSASKMHIGNYSDSLTTAISTIGATEVTLVIDKQVTLTQADTVPDNITLEFTRGGRLTGSYALSINGPILAGLWEIFDSSVTPAGSPDVDAIHPQWFTSNATPGTTDMTTALQAAIDWAKSAGKIVSLAREDYLISSTINLDGGHYLYGNNAEILKTFDGVGLILTGGALYNYIWDLTVTGSGVGAAAGSESVSTSHGISIASRVKLRNVTSNSHKGHGFNITATANLNKSFYDIRAELNDRDGCHVSGTQDDISVWQFTGDFYSNYETGFIVESDCPIRDWDAFIHAAANAGDGTSAQVNLGKSTRNIFWLYAEETASTASEITLGANCTHTTIISIRDNEVSDTGSNNLIVTGGNVIKGYGETPSVREYIGENVTYNNAKYIDIDHYGAGRKLLFRKRVRGDANVELYSYNNADSTKTGIIYNGDGKNLRNYVSDTEVARIDNDNTAGNTRFMIYDVDNGTLERVSVGAADSGGSGYKVLRINN